MMPWSSIRGEEVKAPRILNFGIRQVIGEPYTSGEDAPRLGGPQRLGGPRGEEKACPHFFND
jgi:hypothetical protein